jgi:transcriptional regulator with PAS, ATPase and Fis domain
VAVNSAALPDTLFESELFGYRKGAFSGAQEDRPGLVRTADRGTFFLDEIGDLSADLQAALLRVLQESEVLAVGATRPVAVDLRVIAATHRDLEAMVARGEFRSDLLSRLAGFTLFIPTLRDRREDLGLLIAALLRRQLGERAAAVSFNLPAARALFRHGWPLNVRELEKALEVAGALAADGRIALEHLPAQLQRAAAEQPASEAKAEEPPADLSKIDQKRREELMALLKDHQGNVTAVAKALGKARAQVQRWLKRFGIEATRYRE